MGAGGLSDALRDLAEGRTAPKAPPPPPPPAGRAPAPTPARTPQAHKAATPAPPPTSAPRPAAPVAPRRASPERAPTGAKPRAPENLALKQAAVPVLITVGSLLLFPLGWAIAVLLGLNVWRHDWPGASTMAIAMLAAGPIALFLYAGAWWLHREVRAARQNG